MIQDTSSALRLVTGPLSEPVSLAQAKAFLRIEHAGDDAAITAAISTARQFAEHYLRIVFLAQSWDFIVANPQEPRLYLPVGPGSGITSITLTNSQGDNSILDANNYRLSADGFSILFTALTNTHRMTVRFVASSYATAADIPAPIIQGMLHHVAAQMVWRDGATGLPLQAVNCYAAFRRVSL